MKNRFRKKHSLICYLLVFILIICTGCGSDADESVHVDSSDSDHLLIGMSIDSFLIERWQRDCDVFVSEVRAIDPDAEVNVQNANGDVETQKSQIRYLIEKGADVLVIVCIDSDGLGEVMEEAKDAGIPIIAYDRLINNSNVDLYISFDNEMVGTLMGEALVEEGLENSNVLMLSGPTEDSNVAMVESGFTKVMEENSINIKDCFHAPGWRAEEASDYLTEHIDELEDVDAIMCGNDNIATAVARTLSEARLAGSIKVVGQDADLEACQRVVEGTQVMTVYKPVEKLAQKAAEYAITLGNNKRKGITDPLEDVKETISDGTYDVPYFYIEPIAVNSENIDETIISSGFHTYDEVYLNVGSDGDENPEPASVNDASEEEN